MLVIFFYSVISSIVCMLHLFICSYTYFLFQIINNKFIIKFYFTKLFNQNICVFLDHFLIIPVYSKYAYILNFHKYVFERNRNFLLFVSSLSHRFSIIIIIIIVIKVIIIILLSIHRKRERKKYI